MRLLGARVIMTGMSAELAEALVALDIDVTGLDSFADLQGGVEAATGPLAAPRAPGAPAELLDGREQVAVLGRRARARRRR